MAVIKTRLIIGFAVAAVTFGLVIADVAFDSALCMMLLVVFCTTIALYEFYMIARKKGFRPLWRIAIPTAALMIAGEYFINHTQRLGRWHYANIEFLILFIGIFLMFANLLAKQRVRNSLANVGITVFGLFYIWGLISFIMRLRFLHMDVANPADPTGKLDVGVFLILLVIAVAKMNDSCAFFVGRFLGRRKLAPKISPAKTIEGLVGGLIGGFLGTLAICLIMQDTAAHFSVVFFLVFTMLVGITSHLGDLAESMLKRDAGVKDSAALFPEMGGFLDLIDGLLFASPAAYFVTVFMTNARFITTS